MSGDDLLLEARKLEQNLLNFFWRQGVSYGEGEDLVQETYLRLWEYRDRYRPTAKLSTFLFMIARQVWIDALRRRTRRESREESWGRERPETVDIVIKGARSDVNEAKKSDITATVDVSNCDYGENEAKIKIEFPDKINGVTVDSMSEETAVFTVK